MSAAHICKICEHEVASSEVDDPDAVYHEVTAWVTGPKLQSPVLRTQTGRIAHVTCINRLIEGQAPDQEPLPGMVE